MNNAARIAKLEALLTRVIKHRAELASQRTGLPRPPTFQSALADVPERTATPVAASAPMPSAPAVSSTPARAPAPAPAVPSAKVPAPKAPGKEPEAAEMEFDLPRPGASSPGVASTFGAKPVAPIPLETEGDSVVPFDSTPLASIVPQGTSVSDGLELEIEPEDQDEAPSEMFPEPHSPSSTRPSTPPPLPSTRPSAMPPASAHGGLHPEAIKSPGLPTSPAAVSFTAPTPSASPQSFRTLLSRSLALRVKH